ncbi:uncharacterized protein [Hyperolius riggenbachi]|uniref:uncharacterized protein n=1 Tax=Hyperolius riggenbachi TaxID=752182 RepID=UPI0035A270D4
MFLKKEVVGILSRDSMICYNWLTNVLRRSPVVKAVHPIYISSNDSLEYRDKINKCTLAIIYHTTNRGRVNVTNVTDSLYDEQIEYLHVKIGKDNVIVVVDNLQDSSDQKKEKILKDQPRIKELTRDLFLFEETNERIENMGDDANVPLIHSDNLEGILRIIQARHRRLLWRMVIYMLVIATFFVLFFLILAVVEKIFLMKHKNSTLTTTPTPGNVTLHP